MIISHFLIIIFHLEILSFYEIELQYLEGKEVEVQAEASKWYNFVISVLFWNIR